MVREKMKVTRGLPLNLKNKREFQAKVKSRGLFSKVRRNKRSNMTAVERERQIVADRRREYNKWKSKVKVNKTYMLINTLVKNHPYQLDKKQGIRQSKARKKGYLLKNRRIKDANITMTRFVENYPQTIFAD